MSAAVMKLMLLGVTPSSFVMGTIIVLEHKVFIFFFENAGSIILWNGDKNLPNFRVSHSKSLISNMIHVFWLEMCVLIVLWFINVSPTADIFSNPLWLITWETTYTCGFLICAINFFNSCSFLAVTYKLSSGWHKYGMSFCTPENVITNSFDLTINYKVPLDTTTFLHLIVYATYFGHVDHVQALMNVILNQDGHVFILYFCNLWDVMNLTDVIVM